MHDNNNNNNNNKVIILLNNFAQKIMSKNHVALTLNRFKSQTFEPALLYIIIVNIVPNHPLPFLITIITQ